MADTSTWVWTSFCVLLAGLLAIDLLVLNRGTHVISARRAIRQWALWVLCAMAFNVAVYFLYSQGLIGHVADAARGAAPIGAGPAMVPTAEHVRPPSGHPRTAWEAALMFFNGYLVEHMLSMDNMLVIAMLMRYFVVPAAYQHRVLFWGIIGAFALRGVMILIGAELVQRYHWILYIFGAILLLTAVRMLLTRDKDPDLDKNLVVRLSRRMLKVSPVYDGAKFFTRVDGRMVATPMLLALIVIDVIDTIFAIDSIPAIFVLTSDPFIVFASNCFAVLGLRALYFTIAALIERFVYLKTSLVFVLGFIGATMLVEKMIVFPPSAHLIGILTILGTGLIASIVSQRRAKWADQSPLDELSEVAEEAWKRSRRVAILVIGVTVIGLSIPIGVLLPGPGGIPLAVGGLALLATEFVWARSLLKRVKLESQAMAARADASIRKRPKPWLVPIVVAVFAVAVHFAFKLFPNHPKQVAFGAIGPALAICFWSFLHITRWLRLRGVLPNRPLVRPPATSAHEESRPDATTSG